MRKLGKVAKNKRCVSKIKFSSFFSKHFETFIYKPSMYILALIQKMKFYFSKTFFEEFLIFY